MNFKAVKIIPAILLLFALQASVALPKSANAPDENSLLINGRVVTTEQFAYVTNGILTIAKSNSGSNQKTALPFLIYLKRGSMIVNPESHGHNFAVWSSDVHDILEYAEAGDQLIIDPVKPHNTSARKVITIKKTQIVPRFQWFYILKPKKDNC
ncbi:hypothetical protein [Dyadobacter jiangsuensis]|uniref:Uncharacterized protein n=1 Tax=Dyadobacter jiangsuensis TaxID=1591085 RepID=A0A2P8G3W4_9BACT|nr:hypothetical protein [Dyadobacter jiangsuensis]PSL28674.1 hypothetical protein CLV60_106277 [Dyadobacter jiangsuensis]